jgi:NADPH-dependent glutamate synthase beta subunit-like oxidoreductase
VPDRLQEDLDLQLRHDGTIQVDGWYRTSAPGVNAAGDANRGASLIV